MNEPLDRRRVRALDVARRRNAAALIASDPSTVRWLTGHSRDPESWLAPWQAGTFAVVGERGTALICPEEEMPDSTGLSVYPYQGFTVEPSLDPGRAAAAAIETALEQAGVGAQDTVGVEARSLPLASVVALGRRERLDVWADLRAARAVKDAAEIDLIRHAASLVATGQWAFREGLEPGISEIELWGIVHAAVEREAGRRVPALIDFVFGDRCAEVGGPPTNRRLVRDDLALFDFVPGWQGYWGDSCATVCAGTPTAEMRRAHDAVHRALDRGIEHAKPGVTAGELDAMVRDAVSEAGYEYPHHTGHGVGLSFQEEPRIVPRSTTRLEEGMVIALEPAAYEASIGIRLEHVVVVHPDGGEVLTQHSLSLAR